MDPGFDSQLNYTSLEVVGLKFFPLSLVKIIEELLERKVEAPVLETLINGRGDTLRQFRRQPRPISRYSSVAD
jgi:hypothetical protein